MAERFKVSKVLLSAREKGIIHGALMTEYHKTAELLNLPTVTKNEQVELSNHLAELTSLAAYIKIN